MNWSCSCRRRIPWRSASRCRWRTWQANRWLRTTIRRRRASGSCGCSRSSTSALNMVISLPSLDGIKRAVELEAGRGAAAAALRDYRDRERPPGCRSRAGHFPQASADAGLPQCAPVACGECVSGGGARRREGRRVAAGWISRISRLNFASPSIWQRRILRRMKGRLVCAWLVLAAAGLSAAQNGATLPAKKDPKDEKSWPDAAAIEATRLAAEQRPLFASQEPLGFSLVADFGQVQHDRDPASDKNYPASIVLSQGTPEEKSIAVRIRTRGHSRLKPDFCTFAPLRIIFPANPTGTVFEGQKSLKLGVHCREAGDYPEYTLRRISGLPDVQPPHAELVSRAPRRGPLRRLEDQQDVGSRRALHRRRRRCRPAHGWAHIRLDRSERGPPGFRNDDADDDVRVP